MQDTFLLEFEVYTSPENAWRLFTEPRIVKQYMFGSALESDFQVGSEINFYQETEDESKLIVTGEILEIEPKTRLKHTLFPADAEFENIPENHLHIEYKISNQDGKTILSIEQSKFKTVAEGKKRFHDTASAWLMLRPKIQDLSRNL
jgi:uncharacterized protein YndB with AHSA1/START domain